jgi:quercetin dioxygenase-like cupin family protein
VLDAMPGTPAYIRNGRFDVLGANVLGRALYSPVFESPLFAQRGPVNTARFLFLDPAAKDFWPTWDRVADDSVSFLRSETGRSPHDRVLTDMIGELTTRSDEFATRWARHDVGFHRSGVKRLHHPVVGDLALPYEAMDLAADPRARLPRAAGARPARELGRRTHHQLRSTMQVITTPPTTQGPAELFTGTVHFDVVARGEEPSRMRVNTVRFAPCARTAWHSHSLGQTLHVTEGIGIVATRDQVIIMRPGDTVHTPPGEEHWHGAVSDRFMTHLAMWEDDDATWGEHVTDEEYAAAQA